MGLGRRRQDNANNEDDDGKKDKGAWKRPANTAFKQQRLKAWQPILTPRTVLPTLFIIGLVFGPIGGLLIWGSSQVSQITIDYTGCDALTSPDPVPVPNFDYQLRAGAGNSVPTPPTYSFSVDTNLPIAAQRQCQLFFNVPVDLPPPVFIYYKLTNFFQNHRRYVRSFNSDQLRGAAIPAPELQSGDCTPLGQREGRAVYPCGLIANSIFNDTISNLAGSTPETNYAFSSTGIAWPGERDKYGATTYRADQIIPPPNWEHRFPGGYNDSNIPNFQNDEHFQNWMRTAGLPTFTKLYGRNDNDVLRAGQYTINIAMNFPVSSFGSTKSIVISTVSWIGGKNPFLGWAYIGAAGLFILLAVLGTARHLIKPRRMGDMSLLSWNQPTPTNAR